MGPLKRNRGNGAMPGEEEPENDWEEDMEEEDVEDREDEQGEDRKKSVKGG